MEQVLDNSVISVITAVHPATARYIDMAHISLSRQLLPPGWVARFIDAIMRLTS